MKHYKSFREKLIDCKKTGNLVEIDISKYNSLPKVALVCLKYKTICHSGVCLDERSQKQYTRIINSINTEEDLKELHKALDNYLEEVNNLKKTIDK